VEGKLAIAQIVLGIGAAQVLKPGAQ